MRRGTDGLAGAGNLADGIPGAVVIFEAVRMILRWTPPIVLEIRTICERGFPYLLERYLTFASRVSLHHESH